MKELLVGILIPFLGTTAGAALVFFMKKDLNEMIQKLLTGFAAGVMVAASIWSLLLPSLDQSQSMGKLAFIPAAIGFFSGTMFLLLLDAVTPHLHRFSSVPEGPRSSLQRTTMMLLAVTLHNIPEGMAVGVVFAGFEEAGISYSAALALSLGIAIQNFPEGAIVSMPLASEGNSKGKSFLYGTLSGAVEPVSAFITVILSHCIIPLMPYLLSFAAGAMMYVVVEELIPEMSEGNHSNKATIAFALGFLVMMILDTTLG